MQGHIRALGDYSGAAREDQLAFFRRAENYMELFYPRRPALPVPWPKILVANLDGLTTLLTRRPGYREFLANFNRKYSPDRYFTMLRRTVFTTIGDVMGILRAAAIDCEAMAAFHKSLGFDVACATQSSI